jgi:uncharacterized protein (TIGR00299 family) protein
VTVGWLDCSSGVSGDMLLGALSDLGALDVASLPTTLGIAGRVGAERTRRAALAATAVIVQSDDAQPHRTLSDVLAVIDAAPLPAAVADRARAVFRRLAAAEARVHGTDPDDIEFHEVGALDAIVDVVGACLGLHSLGIDRLVVSPIALGGGQAQTMHGVIPVPGPAVLELLRSSALTSYGGPVAHELATPTGVAVLAEWAGQSGPMPPMQVRAVGVGAGGRDLPDQPNVVRLVVGDDVVDPSDDWQLIEANVDDQDPRLWPIVIERLLTAGAVDAWVTPILMKKGRPAHTVTAMCAAPQAAEVQQVMFAESSTIGVRILDIGKHALDREWIDIDVDGEPIRVKVARWHGEVVNVSPEFDDVVRAAAALGRPVKAVLAAASAVAHGRR